MIGSYTKGQSIPEAAIGRSPATSRQGSLNAAAANPSPRESLVSSLLSSLQSISFGSRSVKSAAARSGESCDAQQQTAALPPQLDSLPQQVDAGLISSPSKMDSKQGHGLTQRAGSATIPSALKIPQRHSEEARLLQNTEFSGQRRDTQHLLSSSTTSISSSSRSSLDSSGKQKMQSSPIEDVYASMLQSVGVDLHSSSVRSRSSSKISAANSANCVSQSIGIKSNPSSVASSPGLGSSPPISFQKRDKAAEPRDLVISQSAPTKSGTLSKYFRISADEDSEEDEDDEEEEEESDDEHNNFHRSPSVANPRVSALSAALAGTQTSISSSPSSSISTPSSILSSLTTEGAQGLVQCSKTAAPVATTSTSPSTMEIDGSGMEQKKELLLLFLLQHVARQLNPDPNYFSDLVRHLLRNGWLSDSRLEDYSFLKQQTKMFMKEFIDASVPLIDVAATTATPDASFADLNASIKRSESADSYLSRHAALPFISAALAEAGDVLAHGLDPANPSALVASAVPAVLRPFTMLPLDFLFSIPSRFEIDFVTKEKIGKGAFGSVYKCQHRIDACFYAVKKVKFAFRNKHELEHAYEKVVREVRALSTLNHPNIVSYNQAWFEPYRKREREQEEIEKARERARSMDAEETFGDSSGNEQTTIDADESQSSQAYYQQQQQGQVHARGKSSFSDLDIDETGFEFEMESSSTTTFTTTTDGGSNWISSPSSRITPLKTAHFHQQSISISSGSTNAFRRRTSMVSFEDCGSDDDDDEAVIEDVGVDDEEPRESAPSREANHPWSRVQQEHLQVSYSNISPESFSPKDMSYLQFALQQRTQKKQTQSPSNASAVVKRNSIVTALQQPQQQISPRSAAANAVAAPVAVGPTALVQATIAEEPIQAVKELLHDMFDEKKNKFQMCLYIQMELCSPKTLEHWLWREGRDVDLREVLSLFVQACGAVEHIHSKKLIHRDIKPSNFFISDNDQVIKLGDFGLVSKVIRDSSLGATVEPRSASTEASSATTPLSEHTEGLGTPAYSAPEQIKHSGLGYTDKVDIFSLGLIFFEMLHPFSTRSERAIVLSNVRQGFIPPGMLEQFPAEMELVRRCTAIEPADRPSAVDLFGSVMQIIRDRGIIMHQPTAAIDISRIAHPVRSAVASPQSTTGTSPLTGSSPEVLLQHLQEKDNEIDRLKRELETLKKQMAQQQPASALTPAPVAIGAPGAGQCIPAHSHRLGL